MNVLRLSGQQPVDAGVIVAAGWYGEYRSRRTHVSMSPTVVSDFHENGFVVVPAVFDHTVMSALSATVENLCEQYRRGDESLRAAGYSLATYIEKFPNRSPGVAPRGLEDEPYLLGVLARHAPIKTFLQRQELWHIAATLLHAHVTQVVYHYAQLIRSPAQVGPALGWHRDFANPYISPEGAGFVRLLLPLQPMDEANGGTGVVAGSHLITDNEARTADSDDLNRRARHWRSAAGALHGPELDIGGRAFQEDDRVLCRRNDRRLGVHNGTLATVTAVDVDQRAVTIRADAGTVHDLPARYLDAGHLTHGYAMTIHKSQGLTVDRCLVLATDTLDHNAGYTALSRGKAENRIYLHGMLRDPEAHHPDRHAIEPREALAASFARDRSDRLAIDHLQPVALRDELQHLYRDRAHLLTVRDAMPPDVSTDIAALTNERADLVAQRSKAQRRLEEVRPGLRHRHRHERLAQRLSAERALDHTAAGLDRVDAALAIAAAGQRAREQYVREHRPELDRLAAIETRIDQRLDLLVDALTTRPPKYLAPLGEMPRTEYGQQCWRDSARAVEAYRIAHSVTDRDTMLGGLPDDGRAGDAWRSANNQLRQLRPGLTPHQSPERSLDPDRGIGISL